ncbi:MAG: SIMPL domain-containing protein [Alphaproteobacteria bacterium]
MTARNLTAALAGAMFLVLTPAAMASDDNQRPYRTISLSGNGEVQARPDTARVNAGVITEGKDARSALAANSAAMAELFKSLKDMGIADRDMQTRNFNIAPRYAPYNRSQPIRENRIIGYRVTNSVAVRVRDLASLGPLLDRLAGAGANQMNGISFYVDKADNLMDEARRRAIADARRKAELYATEAGAKLKRILTIREGGARPGPQPVFRAMAASDAKESVPVAAGEQTIRASVSVTYELE